MDNAIESAVPPGRLAVLSPWLVAGRLPWLNIELSYPERRAGRVISFRLEAAPFLEEWDGEQAAMA